MAAMDREEVPSRAELERAKKELALCVQKLNLLQSQRGRRSAKMRSLESQLFQRVTTIQEFRERMIVAAIQRKLGPRYQKRRAALPDDESPSPTSPAP
jgi:septal ring factor EnvC (AmiA/AmiB activator)